MEYSQKVLFDTSSFKITEEWAGGLLFFHCDVYKNSVGTIKEIKRLTKITKEQYKKDLDYHLPFYTYTRNPKWCKLIGWEYLIGFTSNDKEYEVWIWEEK